MQQKARAALTRGAVQHRARYQDHISLAQFEKAVADEIFTLSLDQKIQLVGAVVVHRVHRSPLLLFFNEKISRFDKLDLRHTAPPFFSFTFFYYTRFQAQNQAFLRNNLQTSAKRAKFLYYFARIFLIMKL